LADIAGLTNLQMLLDSIVAPRVKAGRARISPAEPPMLQPAASNASIRANEFANFPTVIVFHTGTVAADPIVIGGILAEGILLSVK
jgi:hypothetical protein